MGGSRDSHDSGRGSGPQGLWCAGPAGWAGVRVPGVFRGSIAGSPAPVGMGAGVGRRRRCHLSPRRGWGGGARSCACSATPSPILRAGVTSHLGMLPRRGAGPVRRRWGQGIDEVLSLPFGVHSSRPYSPCGGPSPPPAAGVKWVFPRGRCF